MSGHIQANIKYKEILKMSQDISNKVSHPRDAVIQAIPKMKLNPYYKINPPGTYGMPVETIQAHVSWAVLISIPESLEDVGWKIKGAEDALIDSIIKSLLSIYTEEQLIGQVKFLNMIVQNNKAVEAKS